MKRLLVLLTLLLPYIGDAATYKWEDANGIHFTDNLNSVPLQYRPKSSDSKETTIPNAPAEQSTSRIGEIERDREREQSGRRALKQQAAINAQVRQQESWLEQQVLQPLARFLAFWVVIGGLFCIIWIGTIIDIIISEFTDPSNKIVWILLVLGLGPLGLLLYFLIGRGQKKGEREWEELSSRLYPNHKKNGKFDIR